MKKLLNPMFAQKLVKVSPGMMKKASGHIKSKVEKNLSSHNYFIRRKRI